MTVVPTWSLQLLCGLGLLNVAFSLAVLWLWYKGPPR